MNGYKLFAVLVFVLALVLNACSNTPAAEDPADSPTTAARQGAGSAAPTSAPAPPTAAPTRAPTDPTGAADPAGQASGTLAWREANGPNDLVILIVRGLSAPPAGEVYTAWLARSANDETRLALGPLRFADDGTASLTYVAPTYRDLLQEYTQAYITRVSQNEAERTFANVVMRGELPPQALVHIRQILSRSPETPAQVSFWQGLRRELEEMLHHSQYVIFGANDGNIDASKLHAEHVINLIRGSEARDVNGDGTVESYSDGYGLLPNGTSTGYIKSMMDAAQLAADAPDATADMRRYANDIQIIGDTIQDRVEEIRRRAERIGAAESFETIEQDVLAVMALNRQSLYGIDTNLNGEIEALPGEGGVLTAYDYAQRMATISLAPVDAAAIAEAPGADQGAAAVQPTTAPASAPATTVPTIAAGGPTAAAAAPTSAPATAAPQTDQQPELADNEVAVIVADNRFDARRVTIPAGHTIVWVNEGRRLHTITADDGLFDSGQVVYGDIFRFTFDEPGTYPYFCEFHGGPGGRGMAGEIIVEAAASGAAEPAAIQAAPQPAAAEPVASAADALAANATDGVAITLATTRLDPRQGAVPAANTVVRFNRRRPDTANADPNLFTVVGEYRCGPGRDAS